MNTDDDLRRKQEYAQANRAPDDTTTVRNEEWRTRQPGGNNVLAKVLLDALGMDKDFPVGCRRMVLIFDMDSPTEVYFDGIVNDKNEARVVEFLKKAQS